VLEHAVKLADNAAIPVPVNDLAKDFTQRAAFR